MSRPKDNRCDSTRRAFCLNATALALSGCVNKRTEDSSSAADTSVVTDDTEDSAADTTPSDTSETGTTGGETAEPNTEIFLSYIDYPQLQALGGWALVYNSTGVEVMVLRFGDGVKALLGICTHEGCPTEFNTATKMHICPCHGGIFSIGGDVVAGPPLSDMYTRDTRETDIGVFVDLEAWL